MRCFVFSKFVYWLKHKCLNQESNPGILCTKRLAYQCTSSPTYYRFFLVIKHFVYVQGNLINNVLKRWGRGGGRGGGSEKAQTSLISIMNDPLGVIHKWCHTNLDFFWHPFPLCHTKMAFLLTFLYLVSKKYWPPFPHTSMTSFMNDP